VDETPVKLRKKKGSVWVLTNGDLTYYFYRSSREGTFLQELLGQYSGVLITDFYTAYDSLECRQQRCLIHLIRDINDEMLKAPYDEELKGLGKRLSDLLRQIVSTIDDYGLKRRHLAKYRSPASTFIKWTEANQFKSQAAEHIRSRIVKYRNYLFTFLNEDDVAWNNNNAERAMKRFARCRRFADGMFTASSLEETLIILTVSQTCEYRGVNFLQALLGQQWARVDHASRSHIDNASSADLVPLPGYEKKQP
jgi:hypothetical protein